MNISFSEKGWEQFIYWHTQNKKLLRKILAFIKEIERTPFKGTGKPEPLKGNWSGYWSRRIDEGNRLIYRIYNDNLEIAQCKGHYED